MYYNFYSPFFENEKISIIPFIKYPTENSDKTYVWKKQSDRLDGVSNKFYGDPYGAKIILYANATICTNEDEIPDGAVLIIPYPYKNAVQRYITIVDKFKNYY
jgi:hypothetical protein